MQQQNKSYYGSLILREKQLYIFYIKRTALKDLNKRVSYFIDDFMVEMGHV